MKVAIITCYFMPDYVRSASLRAALHSLDGVEPVVIKNRHSSWLRYPEVLWRVWRVRHSQRPDIYILCFRGQELLPALLFLSRGKPLLFDEFIVPLAWATREKHRLTTRTLLFRMLSTFSAPLYKRWLAKCSAILTDTDAHARLSSRLSGVSLKKYHVLPVGTDEAVFYPLTKPALPTDRFKVFFYGLKMTPLHGLPVILQAAEQLAKTHPRVRFEISGGDKATDEQIAQAIRAGARITYHNEVRPITELRDDMWQSNICLGGPFGDTSQAKHVVTGKTYQALACGLPVIIGKNDVSRDFIDKQNCLVVPLGDPQALADAIVWAADHPKELRRMAEAGHKLYQTSYSNQVIAKRLQTTLQRLS